MKPTPSTSAPPSQPNALLRQQGWLVAAAAALALLALALPLQGLNIPHVHYLPLHTLLEFMSILAAFLVFATVWHTPAREASGSLLLIAVALFAAGWLDFAHTLSYKGMPVLLTPASTEKAIAFWLAARLIVAGTLFAVSLRPRLAPPSARMRWGILGTFTALNGLILWAVFFHEADLPRTFIEGQGLTPLKVGLEWLITGLLALAAWRFHRRARESGEEFAALIFGAAALGALSEAFFSQYTEISDALNLLGHLYKFACYTLIYRAMFVVGVRRPYQQLARQADTLAQANATLQTQSLALESITTSVLVTDLDGRVRWSNRASADLVPAPGVLTLSLFEPPITPDAAQAAALRATLARGEIWRGQIHRRDRQGRDRVLERTATPLRDEAGTVIGYVSVAEDITEMNRAQLQHQRVLQTINDGFWIVDGKGHITEANEAYARMSGYTLAELRGMHVTQMAAENDPQQAEDLAARIRAAGYARFEERHRHRDGREYPVEVSATFDDAGGAPRYYVFIRDRSEHAQSQAAQLELERQLQQSQKVQALGQMTGGIAHDFNNILAAILGYANLALERYAPDKEGKLAAYLREVIAASERARDLIAKMLSFTRTRPSGSVQAIAPATVLREVVAMLRPSIPASIEVRQRIDSEQPVRMDPGELNQVLVNLILNARDAVGEHGLIDIRLHATRVHGERCALTQQRLDGRYLALDVSDTGSGIAPEHMTRLFDPFFTTKEVGKGTGLGLSVVHGILRRSGVHIVVDSQPGRGSLFSLLFPVVEAPAAVPPPRADAPPLPAGSGQAIWVVDDEPAVAQLLAELLGAWGYRVRTFADAGEALAALEAAPAGPDLLLTDQTMPGMHGLELAKLARHFHPGLPVILCTGQPEAIDAADAARTGIRHIFGKPLQAAALAQAVAEVLAAPRA